MTPTTYLESIGYEVEELRGNLYQWTYGQGLHARYDELTESQLEAFAQERGWQGPETTS